MPLEPAYFLPRRESGDCRMEPSAQLPNLPAGSKVGLVAGWGRFPVVVAQSLRRMGCEVHCVGLAGHADAGALTKVCTSYQAAGVARIGAHIRYFRRCGVTQATLAGKLFKDKLLFGRWGWLPLVPDLKTIRMFFPYFILGHRDRSDDTLLSTIVQQYARDGIHMAPATDLAPELLASPGTLTRREPTAAERRDIAFGWQLAKEMGRLDIGQSVAVKGRAVIAVEAVEGTDACIRRAGELCPQGGFTVVKVAKPQQDMRFDVPTVGIGTIESLSASGASVLAIEAGKTIIVDRPEVIAAADRHALAIVSLVEP
jgi:DUF1009 family protein